MTLTPREQREIRKADEQRRAERELRETAELLGIVYPDYPDTHKLASAMLVKADARAMGAVTALTTRASESSWTKLARSRRVGVAPGTEDTSDGTCTVKVTHSSGTTEIVPVSHFRRAKDSVARKVSQPRPASQPETANAEKYGTHNLTGE